MFINNQTLQNWSLTSANDISRPEWIIPMTVNIILFVVAFWMLISLVHYGIKTKKWNRQQSRKVDKLNAGLVYSSVVFCAVMCIVRMVLHILDLNLMHYQHNLNQCEVVNDMRSSSYYLVIFSVYIFIWLRQRIFYSNCMLNKYYNRATNILSWAILVFICAVLAVAITVDIRTHAFDLNNNGTCMFLKEDKKFTLLFLIITVSGTGIAQTTLLSLLIYALHPKGSGFWGAFRNSKRNVEHTSHQIESSHYDMSSSSQHCHEKTNSLPSLEKSPQLPSVNNLPNPSPPHKCKRKKWSRRTVQRILKKTILFAIISSLADITLSFVNYFASNASHRQYEAMTGDINAVLNLTFVVLSFLQWKEMLTSPCRSK